MPKASVTKPSGTRVAFGDVVRQVKDRVDPEESGLERYVAGEHMETDDLRIRRWGDVGDGYLGPAFHMRFKPGHVLYGSRRTYLRKVAVADFEGITANTTYVLEPKNPNVLLPELLPFIMQTDAFHQHSVRESKGSVNPYVNFSDLAWFELVLPPIEEQRRMAEVLATADRHLDSLHALVSRAHHCYQATLQSSFPSRGEWISAADVCPFITSGSRGWAQHYADRGATFFRITNMRRRSINPDWSEVKYVNAPEDGEAERTRVATGDVLVSVTAEIGLVTLVTEDFPITHVNQHIAILRPDHTRIVPAFLAYFLASEFGDQQFRRFNDHGAKAGLNLENLGHLQIPRVPVEAQGAVVSAVMRLDQGRESIAEQVRSAQRFRMSLLNNVVGRGRQ